MILTGYIDESGTHLDSPVTVMAGFVGNVHQWRIAERKLTHTLAAFGVSTFHAVDLFHKTREFKGWSEEKRSAFLSQLYRPISDNLEVAFSVTLSTSDYEAFYKGGEKSRKPPLDTKLGLCFRASAAAMYKLSKDWKSEQWSTKKRHRINIVLEDGAKNRGDVERLFSAFKKETQDTEMDFLGTLTIATKKDSVLLLCADLMAYSAYMHSAPGPNTERKRIQVAPTDIPDYKGNHCFIEMTPENLKSLKELTSFSDQLRLSFDQRTLGH